MTATCCDAWLLVKKTNVGIRVCGTYWQDIAGVLILIFDFLIPYMNFVRELVSTRQSKIQNPKRTPCFKSH